MTYSPASDDQEWHGLLGWVAFHLNDTVRVEGVMLRRTARGRLALSYPRRRVEATGEER